MNGVYLEVFGLGLAIALSPVTVIAVILMLLSSHGRIVGLTFLFGWVTGLAIAIVVIEQLTGPVGIGDEHDGDTWVDVARFLLGCLLVLFGVIRWRRRNPATLPPLPSWMQMIDRLTPVIALGVGIAWAGPTPKNLVLLSAAAASISEANLTGGEETIATAILVAAASLGVAIPVVWAYYAGERASGRLVTWRDWLTANNTAVMAVVLGAAGLLLIVKSLPGLVG
jgi:hypothetical protein